MFRLFAQRDFGLLLINRKIFKKYFSEMELNTDSLQNNALHSHQIHILMLLFYFLSLGIVQTNPSYKLCTRDIYISSWNKKRYKIVSLHLVHAWGLMSNVPHPRLYQSGICNIKYFTNILIFPALEQFVLTSNSLIYTEIIHWINICSDNHL